MKPEQAAVLEANARYVIGGMRRAIGALTDTIDEAHKEQEMHPRVKGLLDELMTIRTEYQDALKSIEATGFGK